MKFMVLLGRILFSLIFLMASPGLFSKASIQYAASQGVPWASMAVPFSGALALFGSLSLVFGYKARLGACLLLLFLVPVILMLHAFWHAKDASTAQIQQIMFMKNVALAGGALLVTYFGAGPLSVDAWLKSRGMPPADAQN